MRKFLTFLIAVAAIAFGVCSPLQAQFATLGAQGCGGASCGSAVPAYVHKSVICCETE